MVHSDDDGLVVPPKVAPAHVVILPIFKKDEESRIVMDSAKNLKEALENRPYRGRKLIVEIDDRDIGGARGIPLRIELGPRDMAQNAVFMARRDEPSNRKQTMDREEFIEQIADILDTIQDNYFNRALNHRKEHTFELDDKKEFYKLYQKSKGFNNGAFVMAHWCGSQACEKQIKNDLSVTIRCIPFDTPTEQGRCICCNNSSSRRVLFAKAY